MATCRRGPERLAKINIIARFSEQLLCRLGESEVGGTEQWIRLPLHKLSAEFEVSIASDPRFEVALRFILRVEQPQCRGPQEACWRPSLSLFCAWRAHAWVAYRKSLYSSSRAWNSSMSGNSGRLKSS